MKKYEKKILELAPESGTIYELLRRPVRSKLVHFIDMMFDSLLLVADGLKSNGAYYLLMNEAKADLVHITPDLDVSKANVSTAVQAAANKNSFVYEGNRYKIYRKIR